MATEPPHLRAESQIDVNGWQTSWAAYIEANEFEVPDIRRMHDELIAGGCTISKHGDVVNAEVWLVRA